VRSAVAAGLTLAQERGLLVESNGHMTAGEAPIVRLIPGPGPAPGAADSAEA
jgi:hypothetical protein